jgi:hypothetical protein
MTSTTRADGAPPQPAPTLLDVVSTRHLIEPHHSRTGVVIDIFRQPRMLDGDRYRVEFRGGITEWHWRDELTVQPWTGERDIVLTDLIAVRTILHHAISTAERHDVLHIKLGELFDALTATVTTYLGVSPDNPPPPVCIPAADS